MASCIAVSFSMDSRRHRTSPAETPGSGTNFWSGQRGPGMSEIIFILHLGICHILRFTDGGVATTAGRQRHPPQERQGFRS